MSDPTPYLFDTALMPRQMLGGGTLKKMMFISDVPPELQYSGTGFVTGTVRERPVGGGTGSEVPVRRRVRLYDERSGNCMRETWSDAATGVYRFDYVDMERIYTVLSYDHNGVFSAEVASGVVPQEM